METKAEEASAEPEPTEKHANTAPVVIPPVIAPPAPVVNKRKLSRQADVEDGKKFEEQSVRGLEDRRDPGERRGRASSKEGRDGRVQVDRRDQGERGRADSIGQNDGKKPGDRRDKGERGRADSKGRSDGRIQEQADRPGRNVRREQEGKRPPGDKKAAEKKKLVEMAKGKESTDRTDDVEITEAAIDTVKNDKTERKLEGKRKQRRNEEHRRILELSKEDSKAEARVNVVAKADTLDERHVGEKEAVDESRKGEEEIVEKTAQDIDSSDGIDDGDGDEQTDDGKEFFN